MNEEELIQKTMRDIVNPLIEQSGLVVERAEAIFRDITGSKIPLWKVDMAEVDRQWWYRRARESLEAERRL